MPRIAMFVLTAKEESDFAGYVNQQVARVQAGLPLETSRFVLDDKSPGRFWAMAAQFGIVPPQWRLTPPTGPLPATWNGPVNPDAMTDDDWRVLSRFLELGTRTDVLSKTPVGHPNGQDPGKNAQYVDLDAYVANGGAFSPWLRKEWA